MNPYLVLGIALAAGFCLGLVVLFVVRRKPKDVVSLEIVEEVPAGEAAGFDEPHFTIARDAPAALVPPPTPSAPAASAARAPAPQAPPARPPMRLPPGVHQSSWEEQAPPDPIQTEWARRQVGPVEPGRMKGLCSGCGTALSISLQRPIRIACPVCGRTRLLS